MPGPGQPENAGGNSLKVHAAPFVPGGAFQQKPAQSSTAFPESALRAQPFVPGGGQTAGTAAGKGGTQGHGHSGAGVPPGGAGRGAPTKLAVNAAAFIPKQPDSGANKAGRSTGPDGQGGSDGSAAAGSAPGANAKAGTPAGASPTPAPAQSPAASATPPAGRGPVGGRGGRAGGGGGGPSPVSNQFQAGRTPGMLGRGGRGGAGGGPGGGGPGGGGGSPGPVPGRGGRGGRGAGGGGYMGGGGGMHHPAQGPMMGGGFGGHMGPMPIASYGAGGGGHLPSYRSRDVYMSGPGRAYAGLHFVEEGLRQQLQHRAFISQAQWHDESADDSAPAPAFRLGPYHTLYPLEEGAMGPSSAAAGSGSGSGDAMSAALGLRTALVKGISSVDGSAVALRRVDPKQVIPTAELLSRAREAVESWAPLANHPNLVGLRAAFLASDSLVQPPQPGPAGGAGGGDGASALVFAHDFHPGAVTLAAAHLMPQMTAAGLVSAPQPPPEEVVWSYAVQITSALRAAHGCGLLVRPACLHPSKVLLTGFNRLRIGSVGIVDALMGAEQPGPEEMQMLMRQDITAMGSLLLTLCCAGAGPAPSLDLVAAHYSPELVRLLGALLAAAEGGPLGSWRGLVAALADRAFTELDGAGVAVDHVVGELSKEAENGRLLRLLAKLNFVTERPADGAAGQEGDSSWSETGDRYVLKLFRDLVFHAAAPDNGAPLLDWGLVVEALNKLDAGVPEELLLLGRDGQSMLVVTYGDVKRCLEGAFAELKNAANTAAGSMAGRGPSAARNAMMRT